MQSPLFYWFKPYIFFSIGFLCGGLDHPVKWVAVVMFISASLLIEWWRYKARDIDFEYIEITDIAK